MKILVVDDGSSSLKYQLFDMDGEKVLAKGQVERIGIKGKNEGDGILSGDSETCILIHPSKRGDKLKVLSQAKSSETAAELCMSVEQLLGGDDNGKSR